MNSILRRSALKFLTYRFSSPFSTNIRGLLASRLQEIPLKNDIRFENQNRTWTYKEIEQHSNAFAYGLLELGYKRGDRILVWIDKAYTSEITIAQIGMAKIGIALVPLLSSSAEDFEKAIKETECRGVIFSPNLKDGGKKRSEILYEVFPELETAYSGSPTTFSNYPKLKHLVHVGFNNLPGTIKYRQLLVYANPNFQTHRFSDDIDQSTPLLYAQSGGSYREYKLKDINDFAENFRSQNEVDQSSTIVISGCPFCPGTFASGAYQSIAYGNYVTLYGNESFKNVAEKLRVQQPHYLIINQKLTDEDLKTTLDQDSLEHLKRVLVAGKDAGPYQSVFGGKPVSTFNTYWE